MGEYIVNLHGELETALAIACAGAGFTRDEIVRCRDCRFKAKDGDWCYRTDNEFVITPDGFCKWGERKG